MPSDSVRCNQCGGEAVVKAVLPAAITEEKPERVINRKPAKPMSLFYCPRCGVRSQPAPAEE